MPGRGRDDQSEQLMNYHVFARSIVKLITARYHCLETTEFAETVNQKAYRIKNEPSEFVKPHKELQSAAPTCLSLPTGNSPREHNLRAKDGDECNSIRRQSARGVQRGIYSKSPSWYLSCSATNLVFRSFSFTALMT